MPYGGENGCGLFFCGQHLYLGNGAQLCARCDEGEEGPFEPTADVQQWLNWKLTDESWQNWRDDNPQEVAAIRAAVNGDGGI
jgi:hypothetical protein